MLTARSGAQHTRVRSDSIVNVSRPAAAAMHEHEPTARRDNPEILHAKRATTVLWHPLRSLRSLPAVAACASAFDRRCGSHWLRADLPRRGGSGRQGDRRIRAGLVSDAAQATLEPAGPISFGPVWSKALYLMMAVAAWLVWRTRDVTDVRFAMSLFGVQLDSTFCGRSSFGLGSAGPRALSTLPFCALAIAAATVAFWSRDPTAALLLVPYVVWVSFAAVPESSIYRLNAAQ